MRLSKYLFKVNKSKSNLDEATDRLIRGCFVQKECSGIFRFTNLGFRVIEKIKTIIREELDKEGCLEVMLPILQDISIWEKSGRGNSYGKERFTLQDRKDATMVLAPTAEESATEIVSEMINSYKQLPVTVYQILEKYRDEMRPRFGLVRSRQFIMKDAYSFAIDSRQADELYVMFYNAYLRIFKRMNIDIYPVPSDTGDIGGKYTHEFVVVDENIGECPLYFNNLKNDYINNTEDFKNLECSFVKNDFKNEVKCLELGQIYYLGDCYSSPMKAFFNDKDGELKPFIMGCYGIGVSRILAYIVAKFKYFHEELAPFDVHLIGINKEKSDEFYEFVKDKIDILYDDRDYSPGIKFEDAELIGIPKTVIIGKNIEFRNELTEEVIEFSSIEDLKEFFEIIIQ